MRGNYPGTSDDMVSVGRALVEAITELRLVTSAAVAGIRLASFRPLSGSDEVFYVATGAPFLTRLYIANVSGATVDARLHHVVLGGVADQENALIFDAPVDDGETLQITPGIRLSIGDRLIVRSSTGGSLAFNLYGVV